MSEFWQGFAVACVVWPIVAFVALVCAVGFLGWIFDEPPPGYPPRSSFMDY